MAFAAHPCTDGNELFVRVKRGGEALTIAACRAAD
jgi:hypothetical protein